MPSPQDALAAALRRFRITDRMAEPTTDDLLSGDLLAALTRDGWVLVNAETLAAALELVLTLTPGPYERFAPGVAEAAHRNLAHHVLAALRGDTE